MSTNFTHEAAGLEDKNVVYEYGMLAKSNMKDISLALKELRAALDPEGEYVEQPGYSVTLDMANTLKDIVVAKGGTVAAKEYFNNLEAIADYIKILASIEAEAAEESNS